MKRKFTYLFILTMLCHVQVLFAQDQFRTVSSGTWDNPAIWESSFDGISWGPAGIAPDETDGAITIQNTHTVTVTTTVTANEVVIASGGVLTVNNTLTITDEAGAAVDLAVQAGGTLNIASAMTLSGTFNSAGTVNWSAGNVTFNSATFNNSSILSISGANAFAGTGTNGFNNLTGATITKSSAGNSDLNVPTNNAGTINVNAGSLRTTSSGAAFTNSGAINLANNSFFDLPNATPITLDPGTAITGTGTLRLNGAITLNTSLALPSTVIFDKGGNLTGTGSLTINGSMIWRSNNIAVPLTIASGATLDALTAGANRHVQAALVNNGTMNWNATVSLFIRNAATLTNNGIFNWNATSDLQISLFTGSGSFINNGTFNKTNDGTILTVNAIPFTNSATGIIKGVGTITFTGTGGTLTNSGTVAPGIDPTPSAGELIIDASAVVSGSKIEIDILAAGGTPTGYDTLTLAGTGTIDLTGSTLTIVDNDAAPAGDYVIMIASGGTFSNTFTTVNKPINYGTVDVVGNTVTVHKLYVLPVVWGEFTVKAVDQHAELVWQTLQESNTRNFVVERSKDGISYTALTTITAKGFSSHTSTYSYTDFSPDLNAPNFYRIKQVDLDGKYEYSAIRTLKVQGVKGEYMMIQGNPVKNNVLKVNVTAGDDITIAISDLSGRIIKSKQLQPGVHSIPVSELNAGTYHVSIMQNGKIVDLKRFVKL